MGRIQNKICLVTGGARGIGKATCKLFAEQGAKIAITDIVDDEGEKLCNEICSSSLGEAKYYHLDVSSEKEVEKVIQEVVDQYGGLNVLVNNAGIAGADKPTDQLSVEEWQKVMDINVKGVFLCTKHAIPKMRGNGWGSIINLSSIYGLVGGRDIPPYHASKGAVRLMTKNDALLYAKDGIRVNSVHPGFIWTPLVEKLGQDSDMSIEEFKKSLDEKHPIGHVGEPDDVAYGILYLASDESKFVTGSELVIDGGYTAQ